MYICVCIYDTHTCILRFWGDIYGYIPLRSSHSGLKRHVPYCIHIILFYHCNKQASNVLLSIQFDTNVSQLLRHVLPCSCDPLPSFGELSSSSLYPTSGVRQAYTVPPLPPSGPVFTEKKKGFFYFFKKNGEIFFSDKNCLTSGLTRDWRQVSDVSPTPPNGLTSDVTTKVRWETKN